MIFDTGLTFGTDYQGPAFLLGDTFAYTDALTWIRGRNTWKFGAGFSAYEKNTVYDYYGDRQLEFVGYYAAGGSAPAIASPIFSSAFLTTSLKGPTPLTIFVARQPLLLRSGRMARPSQFRPYPRPALRIQHPQARYPGANLLIIPGAPVHSLPLRSSRTGIPRRQGRPARRQLPRQRLISLPASVSPGIRTATARSASVAALASSTMCSRAKITSNSTVLLLFTVSNMPFIRPLDPTQPVARLISASLGPQHVSQMILFLLNPNRRQRV